MLAEMGTGTLERDDEWLLREAYRRVAQGKDMTRAQIRRIRQLVRQRKGS